jgi:hypothetical protein
LQHVVYEALAKRGRWFEPFSENLLKVL